jgi:hypothetical protein
MSIQDLHNNAMELADLAFIEKFNGNADIAKELFKKAFYLEKEAAILSREEEIGEPSISILLKSAASLALNCDELREAEQLVGLALSGEPHYEIAEELRNLLEEINFQRHLKLNGVSLSKEELQLVLSGPGIGYGMAKMDEVFNRINTFEKISIRTLERIFGKPFREKGGVAKEIKDLWQSYVSVPRPASFAMTIRFGQPTNQEELPGFNKVHEIIDDIVENISLINKGEYKKLKEKINDEAYFRNFVGLSKELAPDGENINLVGITISRDGKEIPTPFTRKRDDVKSAVSEIMKESVSDDSKKVVDLTGRLFAADDDKNNIRLSVEGRKKFTVIVPDGLGDIVKKYWGEQVRIKAFEVNKSVVELVEIDPV